MRIHNVWIRSQNVWIQILEMLGRVAKTQSAKLNAIILYACYDFFFDIRSDVYSHGVWEFDADPPPCPRLYPGGIYTTSNISRRVAKRRHFTWYIFILGLNHENLIFSWTVSLKGLFTIFKKNSQKIPLSLEMFNI